MLKKINILIILILTTGTISAQISTGTPFSAYGYGILENNASGSSTGLGGTSVGLRFPHEINTINPAAYSAIPRQTFLFNTGVRTKRVKYSDNIKSALKYDNAFTGINAAFGINDFWAAGFGAVPYSSIGYKINVKDSIVSNSVNYKTTTNYYGEGGLNKIYFATAFKYKGFSLGVNIGYLFGKLAKRTEATLRKKPFSSYMLYINQLNVRTLWLKYGFQYYKEFNKYNKITIGVTYEQSREFKSRLDKFSKIVIANEYNTFEDTLMQDTVSNIESSLPQGFGFGASFQTKHWLYAFDYETQLWEGTQIANLVPASLKNSYKITGGIEYSPSPIPENYIQAIRFRFGGYYSQNYFVVNGNPVNAYALTFGLGLPAQRARTFLNIGIEVGKQGNLDNNGLKETFIGLNLSFNMAEMWFLKRKFE